MKQLVQCLAFILLCIGALQAQVGIGTTTPDNSATLDITSTDGGVLIPRISLIDITNITAPINNPATGLLIYNTNASVVGGNNEGFYYFNGTIWVKFKIEDGGITTDLKDIGVISAFPGVTYPNDMYLPLDGETFNDVDYPEFTSFITNLDSDLVTDNGNGTFTLADWNNNGAFLRGQGGNAAALGTLQNDATSEPNNLFRTPAHSATTSTDGAHTHTYQRTITGSTVGGFGSGNEVDNIVNSNTSASGTHSHSVTIPQLTITDGGDVETRPINRSITWVIKVKPSASSVNTLTINNYTDIGTDNQIIDYLNLNGTSLEISLEDDGVANETLDLSSLQDGIGTDDQNLLMPTLSGTTLNLNIENGTGSNIDLSPLLSGISQNTLDQAYDEGGPGAGKNINANDGAVRINGLDGFLVTGAYGGGDTIDTELTGQGTRMFFNPLRSAFRAGRITDNRWDDANLGIYSSAFGYNTTANGSYSSAFGQNTTASGDNAVTFGYNTTASGNYSLAVGSGSTASSIHAIAFGVNTTASGATSNAFGYNTTASGDYSTAFGLQTIAPSAFETAIGVQNTIYTANSTSLFNTNDRLFVVGNGTSSANRSNALTIYKSGLMNINDAYDMPLTDGTAGQVLTTAGDGTTSWAAISIPAGTLIDVSTYGTNYAAIAPATYEQPRFYIENNRVYLEGTAIRTTGSPVSGEVIFTLPVGYRPLKQRIFNAAQNGINSIRLDVAANGNVVVLSASPINFISLDGISFRID